jgi:hypothetical protein
MGGECGSVGVRECWQMVEGKGKCRVCSVSG